MLINQYYDNILDIYQNLTNHLHQSRPKYTNSVIVFLVLGHVDSADQILLPPSTSKEAPVREKTWTLAKKTSCIYNITRLIQNTERIQTDHLSPSYRALIISQESRCPVWN
jgi:hypothetical protein